MIVLDDFFDYRDQLLDPEVLCDIFHRVNQPVYRGLIKSRSIAFADLGIEPSSQYHLHGRTQVKIKSCRNGSIGKYLHSIVPANSHDSIIFHVSAKTPNSSRVSVVLPLIDKRNPLNRFSNEWVSYMLDVEKRCFVNSGPVNGAHFIVRQQFQSNKFDKPTCTMLNLRMNDDGQFCVPAGSAAIMYRRYPEQQVHFKVRLRGYQLTDDGPTYLKASYGVTSLDREPEYLTQKYMNRNGLYPDFTKPFPLEPDELVLATLASSPVP